MKGKICTSEVRPRLSSTIDFARLYCRSLLLLDVAALLSLLGVAIASSLKVVFGVIVGPLGTVLGVSIAIPFSPRSLSANEEKHSD